MTTTRNFGSILYILWSVALALFPSSGIAETESANARNIPEVLREWVPWIEARHPEWNCSKSGSSRQCIWPGVFRYELEGKGARFELAVEVQNKGGVPLPSSAELYPRNIEVVNEKKKS